MTDALYLELLACLGRSIAAAQRSLSIAETLMDAHRSGQRLPDAVINAYAVGLESDQAQLAELRAKVLQFKGWFRTH